MMDLQEIRNIAIEHGLEELDAVSEDEVELIHAIQREEGNFDCFATATHQVCDQESCLWRDDCFALAQQETLTS